MMFIRRNFIVLLSAIAWVGCSNNKEGLKPEMKPLMEAVYASGFVISKDEYEIFAQVEGYVADKLVQDGDLVKKGDPLYVIEAGQQSARYRIAKETYELAAKNYRHDSPVLREVRAAMETTHDKMQFDSLNYVRFSNLMKSNATSKAEFDRMKLAYENSQHDYILQRSRYEKSRNQLYLEYENARNQLVIASDEAGRYIVRSEVDGLVFMTSKDKGELIRRNEVIAVVGKRDAFYLQLNVDELDVQRVQVGQETLVKIDAYPNKVFKGKITKVYPLVDRRQQAIRVDAELNESLPGWFSGLALEANIIIRKKDAAVVIPKTMLLPGDSVLINTEDGARKVKVVRGIETLDQVEILEGLDTSKRLVMK
ncbi:MAG: efflux RND transporter periplasmic adaptor subunit [Bacteroidota bacterium]